VKKLLRKENYCFTYFQSEKVSMRNLCNKKKSVKFIFITGELNTNHHTVRLIAYSYSRMYMKILSLGKRYAGMKRIELRSIAKILLIVTPHLILHAFYIVMFLFYEESL
jgi:hypothetical protein